MDLWPNSLEWHSPPVESGLKKRPMPSLNQKFIATSKRLNLTKGNIILESKNKTWILKAVDHSRERTIAWVTGARDAQLCALVWKEGHHWTDGICYTGDWEALAKVWPKATDGWKIWDNDHRGRQQQYTPISWANVRKKHSSPKMTTNAEQCSQNLD